MCDFGQATSSLILIPAPPFLSSSPGHQLAFPSLGCPPEVLASPRGCVSLDPGSPLWACVLTWEARNLNVSPQGGQKRPAGCRVGSRCQSVSICVPPSGKAGSREEAKLSLSAPLLPPVPEIGPQASPRGAGRGVRGSAAPFRETAWVVVDTDLTQAPSRRSWNTAPASGAQPAFLTICALGSSPEWSQGPQWHLEAWGGECLACDWTSNFSELQFPPP